MREKLKILIVEDNMKTAERTRKLLEEMFGSLVDVTSVHTGSKALEVFSSGFDICIIDLRLELDKPEAQGTRLLEKIREIEKKPSWRHGQSEIVIQSAHITLEIKHLCEKYSISDWIEKRHPSELIESMERIAEKRGLVKDKGILL